MRRYLRALWDAICGRRITEVEFSQPLRLTWKGRTAFEGRVVGYSIDVQDGLGGATATLSLHDASHDMRLLRRHYVDETPAVVPTPKLRVEDYERYGNPEGPV